MRRGFFRSIFRFQHTLSIPLLFSASRQHAFLSYLELIIELNADMKDALKDHTAALDALQMHIDDFSKLSEVQEIKNL